MLKIIRLEDDVIERIDLKIGNNIIGRGAATGSNDDSVIRPAFTINLAPSDDMTITTALPCYIKGRASSRWRLLKPGAVTPIYPGDICSLLPYKCWFKIISMAENTDLNPTPSATKRKAAEDLADSNDETEQKKRCVESPTCPEPCNEAAASEFSTNNEPEPNKIEDNEESRVKEKVELVGVSTRDQQEEHSTENSGIVCDQHAQGDSQPLNGLVPISNEQAQSSNAPAPATEALGELSKKPWREKCKYGKKCYRRNPEHKSTYSHHGDDDYNVPDTREECPYGKNCYRTSTQHKAQFKHTANSKGNGKLGPRKKTNTNANQGYFQVDDFSDDSAEESVDESDYEPSSESRDNSEDEYRSEFEWEDEAVV